VAARRGYRWAGGARGAKFGLSRRTRWWPHGGVIGGLVGLVVLLRGWLDMACLMLIALRQRFRLADGEVVHHKMILDVLGSVLRAGR
jgi:hypothetical protein